mgnify:CR=1 FL=1
MTPRPTLDTPPTDPSAALSARVGTLLGVWAHPDDEAYLSAALMALTRRHGQRVVVISAVLAAVRKRRTSRRVSRVVSIVGYRFPLRACSMMKSPVRHASAMMVSVGFLSAFEGNGAPSQRKRFFTSHVWFQLHLRGDSVA